eukprot:3625-Heterococcus_DN1.PRE.3
MLLLVCYLLLLPDMCPQTFSPDDKAIRDAAHLLLAFLEDSTNKYDDLKQVPGIGGAYEKTLQEADVGTTQGLIAKFNEFKVVQRDGAMVELSCLEQCNKFYDWLSDTNGLKMKSDCCNKIVNAIAVKVNLAIEIDPREDLTFLFTAGWPLQRNNNAPLDHVIPAQDAVKNITDAEEAQEVANNNDDEAINDDDNAIDAVLPPEPALVVAAPVVAPPGVVAPVVAPVVVTPVAAAPVVVAPPAVAPVVAAIPAAAAQQQQQQQQPKQSVQFKIQFGMLAALVVGFILGVMFTLALAYFMNQLRLSGANSGYYIGFADVCKSQSSMPTLSDTAYIHGAIVSINSTAF